MPLLSAATLAAFALSAPVPAIKSTGTDWPTFRGADRSGVLAEKSLPAWPKDGPKLLWQKSNVADIGVGYGSPAVVGGKVYLFGSDNAKQTGTEFVTCLDAADGKKVWVTKLETTPGKYSDGWGGGPRCTPTVANDMVYVLGATGDLVALSADKGEVRWKKNLVKDFGGGIPTWGYSESPTVDGDNLICTPGNKGGMIALNAKTGETVWQCKDLTDGAGYSSIVITEFGGVRVYITQTMQKGVGVRAKDGKLLWSVGEIGRRTAVIPTPVVGDDGYVFFTAGYGAGCECFKLTKDGDGVKAATVYTKNKDVANHHGGVAKVGDFVFGHSDSNGWVCFDYKKGEVVWKDKGVGKGSMTAIGDTLLCYSEQAGKLARVKATDKGYMEEANFTIPATSKVRPNQGKVWAHPVVSGGKLFLRDYELLYVYDVTK
ncbi:MAG: PQQ-like beta-propeller repeat protein [Fimbriiglobus sp.]|jgi:outer membrane protein assembly factor BamB|nr:PQQ-like beta-propeller repeat protein [Fimbriiglobus sp.]